MKHRIVRYGLFLGAIGALAILVALSGVVPVKASSGHWGVTAWFLRTTMQRSVALHSLGIDPPPLDESRLVLMGAGHFEGGCRFCHGAPGSALPGVPRFMTPHPPALSERVGLYDDAELFYIVRHGIKMTGMPAWPAPQREDEVWGVVAFLRRLPSLDAAGYERLVYGSLPTALADNAVPGGNGGAPAVVVQQCARCHGLDGRSRGHGAFPRLAGQHAQYLEASLIAYARGTRHSGIMQPVAVELDAERIRVTAEWYSSREPPIWKPPDRRTPGQRIAERGIPERRIPACAGCHGPGHEPHHPGYPKLFGQYPEYLAQQLQLFTEKKRGGASYAELMSEAVTEHELEPDQIEAVAKFYAGR